GLVEDTYCFVGFLPRREGERRRLWAELDSWRGPVVAFESPRRLPATLRALAERDPAREVAVCRELTQRFEEISRGPVGELAVKSAEAPKGEVTLVFGPGRPPSRDAEAVEAAAKLVAAGASRRVVSEVVAELTGVPKNELYKRSLEP